MSAAPLPAVYTIAASYYHWMVAIPLIGAVGTVLKAQQAPKEEKGDWMFRHKSLGLLTGMMVAPRLAYRLFGSKAVRQNMYSLMNCVLLRMLFSQSDSFFLDVSFEFLVVHH